VGIGASQVREGHRGRDGGCCGGDGEMPGCWGRRQRGAWGGDRHEVSHAREIREMRQMLEGAAQTKGG